MKKIMGVLAIMMFVITSFAQKFDKVKNEILINQFELAKVDFDKILQKNPTLVGTPEAIFWEAKILTGYLKDSALSKKYANSFENMQNNLEKLLSSESGNSFLNEKYKDPEYSISDPFIQIYTKIRNDGVEKYNQKKFNDAANLFKICVKYSDVFYGRGWIDPKIKSDSLTILFTAICYKEDKNYKDAIPYLERLINEKSMTRLEGIFGDLIDCLIETKDKENLNKYIDLAKKEYPFYVEDWNQRSFKFISKYYTNEEKVKLYDDVTAKSTLTEAEYQLYGDMFTTAKMENPNEEIFFEKANDAYVKMFNLNKKNTAAAINIGINYYNKFNELDEKYTANIKSLQKLNAGKAEATPKNIKDKANFEKTFKAQVDSIKNLNVNIDAKKKINADASIEWNTVAYDLLKDKVDLERIDKNILGKAVRMLTVLYDYKKSKEQGKDQKALLDYEEKYKKFDALMDKYQ
jgi:hypothetical protein